MLVPYGFSKCIVCLKSETGDPEHVIPQVIGGRLSAKLLCNKCNHHFGSKIVSGLKTDPSIRLAMEVIKKIIPEFADQFLEGSEHVSKSEDESDIRLRKCTLANIRS